MKRKKQKYHKIHSRFTRWWRRYQYKHSSLAFCAILLFVITLDTAIVQALLSSILALGLWGVFIAGILFVSFFTAVPALIVLLASADSYNPLTMALVAGSGSLIGDWVILKIFEEKVAYELFPLAKKFGLMPIIRLFKRKVFRPVALSLGALIVLSPLPDELGVALLGLSHLALPKLLIIIFVLNAVGIYAIIHTIRLTAG